MAIGQLDSILRRDDKFLKEMWTWFGVGALVILLRFFVRIRMVGPRGLKGDDYTMLVTDMARTWISPLPKSAPSPMKKWHDLYKVPSSNK
ncbi:hypothetical protein CTAM01_08983 [Colletotrichum tamarilloi]|uniref:Uncharacterized protein n=1 Tax=Colletotrichum tamarilloi TaxID=1209934 RepID=A0ABQ9R4W7_9PEZI|nr:uncharacterized protein CTAM01_08983 [Colletotrichum tamarilloi]KAI3533932.1 hypothetical protein CSPX01_12413 [Colletotrichum filicis]KAK1494629.1 hypothetical protein CTAM01_08983 [Colletotrichum tamarilloi]